MKKSTIIIAAIFLIAISLGAQVWAQDTTPKDPYSGDLLTRSTLTGDWGGLRNEWATKGVTIDLNVTQIGQGVVNGGKSSAWQYGGRGDLTINLDSQKLGLWPGGFFNLELEGNWVCSPSRATFLIGRPPQFHHVIDQMQYSFVLTLDPKIPNVGSVLKGLGYKTAYFGKFEMGKGILNPKPTVNYSTAAQPYGCDVFSAGGDIGSAPRSGFDNDPFIAGESVRWLRVTASEARRTGQPFFMVASFVNPHDIMFGDGNIPGQPLVQKAVVPQLIPPPPPNSIYEKKWSFTLPASLQESLTAPGMPGTLLEYQRGWDGWSGTIPADRKDMWTIFYNYYLNTIRDSDRSIQQIVDVLNDMDLWRDTVVVF